jgi:hypothetical protein
LVPKERELEGIMERKHQPRPAGDTRPDRGQVKLDRRYGKIGISAVAAAVRYQGNREQKAAPQPSWALSFDRD